MNGIQKQNIRGERFNPFSKYFSLEFAFLNMSYAEERAAAANLHMVHHFLDSKIAKIP